MPRDVANLQNWRTPGLLAANPFLTLGTENRGGRRRNVALPGRKLPGHPDIDPWWGLPLKEALFV